MMVMAVVLTVAAIGTAFRLKRRLDMMYRTAQPDDHRLDDMVGPDAQPILTHLRRQMPIAQMPGDAYELMPIAGRDLDQRFARRLDSDPIPGIELKAVAVGQSDGTRQIQQDRTALVQIEAQSPAMPLVEGQGDTADGLAYRPGASMGV
jgi:hypothetical protein